MNNSQLINQDSGNVEYYTPDEVLACVHAMFPVIDLDPASCELANQNVKAKQIFTIEDNALTKDWVGDTLWMNHPFTKGEKACKPKCIKKICNDPKYKKYRGHCITEEIPSNLDWINYYLEQFNQGHFKEGLNITFSNTSETWCQKLLNAGLSCFIDGRTHFNDAENKATGGATKGCFVTYLGNRTEEFKTIFSKLGAVKQ